MHKQIAVLGWLMLACSSAGPAAPGLVPDIPDSIAADALPDAPLAAAPPIPCDAACSAIETCNVYTGKCVNLCGGFCTPSEICQVTAGKGTCVAKTPPGVDAGADGVTGTCTLPTAWSPNLQRISKLAIADVTLGCDLDGDGKPNNVFGKMVELYKDVNVQIQKGADDGTSGILLDAPNFRTDGGPFAVTVLGGHFAAATMCQSGQADCEYVVDPDSYDLASSATAECTGRASWPEASVAGGALQATGLGPAFPFISLGVPGKVQLWIRDVTVTGTTTGAESWQTTTAGWLCGGIAVKDLEAATGGSGGILKPDFALTPGGPKDAISVALTFETVRAKAVGLVK